MNKWLYCGWGIMYILCVALSLIPEVTGVAWFALLIFSLTFFVPGFLLLYNHLRDGNRKGVALIRGISLVSLASTLVCLVLFFLFAGLDKEAAVSVTYEVLALVSAPMLCSQYWVVSLFLWACLLFTTFLKKPAK
jgi:hypothetical protein